MLLLVGIFGTSLFYGDGVITPAISVLSAVEGLEVISPALKDWVIPLTIVILLCLFSVQKRGTAGIGRFFGPVTLVWFATLAALGVSHIARNPKILQALSPHHALRFMFGNPGTSFIILGAVVLCVTGAEALYADLGHFGKKPIRLAWFSVVMPSLTLNYFGQGALLLMYFKRKRSSNRILLRSGRSWLTLGHADSREAAPRSPRRFWPPGFRAAPA